MDEDVRTPAKRLTVAISDRVITELYKNELGRMIHPEDQEAAVTLTMSYLDGFKVDEGKESAQVSVKTLVPIRLPSTSTKIHSSTGCGFNMEDEVQVPAKRLTVAISDRVIGTLYKEKMGRIVHPEDQKAAVKLTMIYLDGFKVDEGKECVQVWVKTLVPIRLPSASTKIEFCYNLGMKYLPGKIQYGAHVVVWVEGYSYARDAILEVLQKKPRYIEVISWKHPTPEERQKLKQEFPLVNIMPLGVKRPITTGLREMQEVLESTSPSERGMPENGYKMSDYSQERLTFTFSYAELEDIIKTKTGRLIHGEDRDLLLTVLINNLEKLKVASDTAKESIYVWISSSHHVTLPKMRDDDKYQFIFCFGKQIPACITYNGHVTAYVDDWVDCIDVIDQVIKLKPKFLEIFCQQDLSMEDSDAMKKTYPWIKLTPIALGKAPSRAITDIKMLLCRTTPASRGMAEFGWSKRKLAEKNDEEQPPKKKDTSLAGDFEDNVAATEVKEQERKLKEVTARYEAAKEDMRRLKDKATAASELLNRRIKELEAKVKESAEGESVKECSNNQIMDLRAKIRELEMAVQNEKLVTDLAKAKWELATKEVSELKKAKEELENQLESSRTSLSEMRNKYDNVRKELEKAKEDLAKAGEKEKKLEQKIKNDREQRRRNRPSTRNSPRTNMKDTVDRLARD